MRVPVVELPRVGQAALPGVRRQAPTDTGIGALAQGMQGLARGVAMAGDAYQQAQERADSVAVDEAFRALQERKVDLEHGAEDGSTKGYYSLRGREAMAASGPALEALQKEQAKLAGGLNERQRQLFVRRSHPLMLATRQGIESYADKQMKAAEAAAVEGVQASGLRDVANNYANEEAVATAEAGMVQSLRSLAGQLPPEALQAREEALRQQVTAARLQGYLSAGDYDGAKALFDSQRERLGPLAGQFEHRLKVMGDGLRVGRKVAQIAASSGIEGYPWLSADEVERQIRELPEGPDRDGIARGARARLAESDAARQRAIAQAQVELDSLWESNGHNLSDPRIIERKAWLLDVNNGGGSAWRKWEAGVRLEERQSKVSTSGSAAAKKAFEEEQDAMVLEFQALPYSEQAEADIDALYRDGATRKTRARMKVEQKKAQEKLGSAYKDFRRTVDAAAAQTEGLKKGFDAKKNSDEWKRLVMFRAYMNDWYDRATEDGGKPRLEDVQKAIGDALEYDAGGFFTGGKFRYEVDAGGKFESAPPDKQRYPGNRTVEEAAPAVSQGQPMGPPATPAPTSIDDDEPEQPREERLFPPVRMRLSIVTGLENQLGKPPSDEQVSEAYRAQLEAAQRKRLGREPTEAEIRSFDAKVRAAGSI